MATVTVSGVSVREGGREPTATNASATLAVPGMAFVTTAPASVSRAGTDDTAHLVRTILSYFLFVCL